MTEAEVEALPIFIILCVLMVIFIDTLFDD